MPIGIWRGNKGFMMLQGGFVIMQRNLAYDSLLLERKLVQNPMLSSSLLVSLCSNCPQHPRASQQCSKMHRNPQQCSEIRASQLSILTMLSNAKKCLEILNNLAFLASAFLKCSAKYSHFSILHNEHQFLTMLSILLFLKCSTILSNAQQYSKRKSYITSTPSSSF